MDDSARAAHAAAAVLARLANERAPGRGWLRAGLIGLFVAGLWPVPARSAVLLAAAALTVASLAALSARARAVADAALPLLAEIEALGPPGTSVRVAGACARLGAPAEMLRRTVEPAAIRWSLAHAARAVIQEDDENGCGAGHASLCRHRRQPGWSDWLDLA